MSGRNEGVGDLLLLNSFVTGGQAGAVVGAAMGPVLTYMNLRGLCDLVLYGKCYSLRFDEDALRRDRGAVFSAAVGYLSSGAPGFIVGLDVSFVLSKLVNFFS
uniref:Ammonium_transp domain-containing protein n=1 Tax=Caenorhabditis tropicalis TaxID=1561998 RepID=A0A1I7UIV4_9PELO